MFEIFYENFKEVNTLIEVNNISKTFKTAKREHGFFNLIKSLFVRKFTLKHALKNVSFRVDKGEIIGYIGPNGAGKSTTIKIMCGILTPTSGSCVINGYTPWKDRIKYVKNIGAVFGQRTNLSWDVPIIDSYELLKEIYKIPQAEYDKMLDLLTEKLQIKDLLDTPLRQLSLGQNKRCEIAGALLHNPQVLFLDEPTIGLDSVSKLAVRNFIKYINEKTQVTVILTTHDMSDIEALTNRVILIGKGEILYDGSFENIKNKYGKNKKFEVEFMTPQEKVSLRGYKVLNFNGNSALFEPSDINVTVGDFIQKIEKKYKIKDLKVITVSIEEVISNLYKDFEI